jgi:hypothetical protein
VAVLVVVVVVVDRQVVKISGAMGVGWWVPRSGVSGKFGNYK